MSFTQADRLPQVGILPCVRSDLAVRRRARLVAQQLTGLTSQRLAQPGQGAEPDRPRSALLEFGIKAAGT
jgi:hypothetical protein